MRSFKLFSRAGFTLIELIIVMSIVGILASIAAPNFKWALIKARESVLRENLYTFTSSIDQYYADQGKYPDKLEDLTDPKHQYMREIPKDPFTGKADWRTQGPPASTDGGKVEGSVYNVKSSSDLVGSNSIPYSEW